VRSPLCSAATIAAKRTASQSEKLDNTGSQGGRRRIWRVRRCGLSRIIGRKQMKMTLLVLVAASVVSLSIGSYATATPADGAAIARIAHEVDPAINVATKKKSAQTAAKSCPEGQQLSTRTGKCRTPTAEQK
jgi:hypothetical protein